MTNQEIIQAFNQLGYEVKLQIQKVQDEIAKADRDGYLGDLYRTDYSVIGRGAFPVDMLRYACSWPADETSAGQIERSHESDVEASDPFSIRLTRYHRDPVPNLCDDRWESKFRWKVVRTGGNMPSTSRL